MFTVRRATNSDKISIDGLMLGRREKKNSIEYSFPLFHFFGSFSWLAKSHNFWIPRASKRSFGGL